MTGPKMEYEWKILFESMNSMNAPGYTSEEISVLLTQAEYEMVIEVAQNASDSNDYARMVLGKLLTPYSNPTIAPSTVLFSENAYRVTLPTGLETPTPIPEFFYPFIEFAVTTVTTTPETPDTTVSTEEPKTTTPGKPNKPSHSDTTTTSNAPGSNGGNNGGRRKPLLPNTGEVVASGLVFSGILVLAGAVGTKRKLTRQ